MFKWLPDEDQQPRCTTTDSLYWMRNYLHLSRSWSSQSAKLLDIAGHKHRRLPFTVVKKTSLSGSSTFAVSCVVFVFSIPNQWWIWGSCTWAPALDRLLTCSVVPDLLNVPSISWTASHESFPPFSKVTKFPEKSQVLVLEHSVVEPTA